MSVVMRTERLVQIGPELIAFYDTRLLSEEDAAVLERLGLGVRLGTSDAPVESVPPFTAATKEEPA